jgi:hypothetical protein
MGVGASHFVVHARARSSNEYAENPVVVLPPESELSDALGVFKREMYALALRRDYNGDSDPRCLYLYLGWWRLARAEVAADRSWLRLHFRSPDLREAWFAAEERLGPQRWPLCGRQFGADFTETEPAVAGDAQFLRNEPGR